MKFYSVEIKKVIVVNLFAEDETTAHEYAKDSSDHGEWTEDANITECETLVEAISYAKCGDMTMDEEGDPVQYGDIEAFVRDNWAASP